MVHSSNGSQFRTVIRVARSISLSHLNPSHRVDHARLLHSLGTYVSGVGNAPVSEAGRSRWAERGEPVRQSADHSYGVCARGGARDAGVTSKFPVHQSPKQPRPIVLHPGYSTPEGWTPLTYLKCRKQMTGLCPQQE